MIYKNIQKKTYLMLDLMDLSFQEDKNRDYVFVELYTIKMIFI